ncbi:claudin-3-like [Corythoichthys intestinalis]|uniref:claudin-3-like n=1 Tax=Corythoichthys intestinalis TaxID=161448 RepID=UPI0025A61550|nr:claudin-3-like [Corythoichthys intestinalis]XP_057695392.1 claudin-3-like [Corythoichthys intestinalis]XP_061797188.1 claudin-3-like [Nerophis lumbriciformis]
MVSQGVQMIGISSATVGWFMVIVTCALPMWKVTAFVGANIITAQTIWQGLWMNCVVQSTGQMQCKVYDSMLALERDLQAARAMIIISILLGVFGVAMSVAGGKCTNCIREEVPKARACILAGALFLASGLLCLIPVSWSANAIVSNFYNPLVIPAQRFDLSVMGRIGKETAGQVIGFIGLVGVAVTTGIPMWRVTTFIGANIVTGQIVWDGLWMNCVMQSTGQMQCRLSESVITLTPDLQAARALVIISLVFGFIGFMVTFIGAKCTSCLQQDASKARVVIIGGVLLIIAAVLVLIPVTWSATITITDFQNPLTVDTQRREIGASIYIGWASTALLLVGGIILTTSCPPQTPMYPYAAYPYANGSTYAPVYAPPSSQPYTPSGSYYPAKPYAAPSGYSPRQYI